MRGLDNSSVLWVGVAATGGHELKVVIDGFDGSLDRYR